MNLIRQISVVKEGTICGSLHVHAMHDATEGGILGAVWEITEASKTGCLIDMASIPLLPETDKNMLFSGSEPLCADFQRKHGHYNR